MTTKATENKRVLYTDDTMFPGQDKVDLFMHALAVLDLAQTLSVKDVSHVLYQLQENIEAHRFDDTIPYDDRMMFSDGGRLLIKAIKTAADVE